MCRFKAQFVSSVAGARTAAVDIADDAPGNPQDIALSGTDVAPAGAGP